MFFNSYCQFFKPNFRLWSLKALNRSIKPSKSFLIQFSNWLFLRLIELLVLCFISVGKYLRVKYSNCLFATFFLLPIANFLIFSLASPNLFKLNVLKTFFSMSHSKLITLKAQMIELLMFYHTFFQKDLNLWLATVFYGLLLVF